MVCVCVHKRFPELPFRWGSSSLAGGQGVMDFSYFQVYLLILMDYINNKSAMFYSI